MVANPNYQQYVKGLVRRNYLGNVSGRAVFQNVKTAKPSVSTKPKSKTIVPSSAMQTVRTNITRNPGGVFSWLRGEGFNPSVTTSQYAQQINVVPSTIPNTLLVDTLFNRVPGSLSPAQGGLLVSAFPEVRQREDFLARVKVSKTYDASLPIPPDIPVPIKKRKEMFKGYVGSIPPPSYITTNTYNTTTTPADNQPFDLFSYVDWKTLLLVGGIVAVYFLSKSNVGSTINLRAV